MLSTNYRISTSLRDKTLDLIQNRSVKLTFLVMSAETGIGERWMRMFSKDQIPNPGVNTIQTLYEYLSKKKLEV